MSSQSQWVNKFSIMRDLSMAQGCIPVDVAGTVTSDQKPPSQNILEETEEEWYRNWVGGDGDFSTPDVGFIKHMLNVVRDYEGLSDVEDENEKIIEIRKLSQLNPIAPEYKPISEKAFGDNTQNSNKAATKIHRKPKKQRNMAIESLLQNLQNCSDNSINHQNGKLLKPTDFTVSKVEAAKENISQAINKVTGWLDTQEHENKREKTKKTPTLTLDTASMFKKKEHPLTIRKVPLEDEVSEKPPSNGYQEYVPSSNAAAYYKKFLECSRMKQILQEDVWTRAERQMKELEEQRKKEAEQLEVSLALSKSTVETPSSQSTSDLDNLKLDIVRLPSHRHNLPSPCTVCSVMNKETVKNSGENWREQNDLCETIPDVDKGQIKSWRTREDNSKDTILSEKEVIWRISKTPDKNVESVTNNNTCIQLDKDFSHYYIQVPVPQIETEKKIDENTSKSLQSPSREANGDSVFKGDDDDDDDDDDEVFELCQPLDEMELLTDSE